MRACVLVALAGLGISSAMADGSQYSCARGDTTRRVAVLTDPSERCEVQYHKGGEAAQVLWHADNNIAYCERQAKTLVARLDTAGWDCSSGVTAATNTLPEPLAVPVAPMDGAPREAANTPSPAGVTGSTQPAPLIDPSVKLRGTIH